MNKPPGNRKPSPISRSRCCAWSVSREAVSRIELARELSSSRRLPASMSIVDSKWLPARSPRDRPHSRSPPSFVDVNPQGGRFIGVDFDARQIMTVAVDFAQNPLEQISRTIPARATPESILALIEESIEEVIGARRRNLLGIGLGVPGPVDSLHGISRRYPFISGWNDVPVGPQIAARFEVPVFVENNVRSMALGELWCGEGRGLHDLVCLGIRSGIGSGIVVQGQLLQGTQNLAGEIGRWAWPFDTAPVDTCGRSKTAAHDRRHRLVGPPSCPRPLDAIEAGETTTIGTPGELPTVAQFARRRSICPMPWLWNC